jgi:hypothetical protein
MKFITFLFTVFFWFNAVAVAPYGIKGQSQSGTLYSNVHQFPNNQVTNMGGINALVETGNKNILVNPSFEHSTFSTGWTSGAGSFSQNLTVEIDGLKAAEVTLSSQSLAITQDSTLYAAQFADGVQGLASVRVKTSLSGIRVCSRQAGVTSTTNCVNVQGNGKWGLYKVPMILGATSNGISIASNGTSLTGTVYLDDSFVGAVDLQATVDASKVAGESFFAGTASCIWSRTSTTVGALTATAACPGPTIVAQNMGSWQTTDSDLPRQTINNLPAGTYKAKFIFGASIGVTAETGFAISDGTTTCEAVQAESGSVRGNVVVECSFVYTSTGNRTFELFGASTTGTLSVFSNQTAPRISTKFILEYFGNSSVYSSTNADTDWASCGHTTSSFTGFGTVSAIETQCKRQGGDLLMKGKFTAGTPTGVEARVSLPLWNGVQLVSANSSIIPTIQISGSASSSFSSATFFGIATLQEPSASYITLGLQNSTGSSLTKSSGNALLNASGLLSFSARIPIEGWQNSNIIIGQFNGLESCTNTLECTDTFSAKVSAAGVVSDENVNWINGNASIVGTSVYNITFNTGLFTTTPNCVATPNAASGHPIARIEGTPTSSGVSVYISSSTANFPSNFSILCQKQGADYIGKTAKAVASDQNVSSPGTIKATFCSADISATGVISNQDGGCFASCTNATTPVCTFTSNFWVGTPKCWYSAGTAGYVWVQTLTPTTFAGTVANNNGVAQAGARQYFCHGARQ